MTKQQRERSQLRSSVRARRRSLSTEQQEIAANQLFSHIKDSPDFLLSHRLAFYIAFDGEISPHLLVEKAHSLGKQCYLPVLPEGGEGELLFAEYNPETRLHKNFYTLSEPTIDKQNTAPAYTLDVVFMPLVAFDSTGARLGMGKGYYDKSFAFLKNSEQKKPKLIGLAHECQRVEKLQVADWDVPLNKIITDQKIYTA